MLSECSVLTNRGVCDIKNEWMLETLDGQRRVHFVQTDRPIDP
jgi:hypothetical protein